MTTSMADPLDFSDGHHLVHHTMAPTHLPHHSNSTPAPQQNTGMNHPRTPSHIPSMQQQMQQLYQHQPMTSQGLGPSNANNYGHSSSLQMQQSAGSFQQLEQRAFNSGALGARTLPTAAVMGVCAAPATAAGTSDGCGTGGMGCEGGSGIGGPLHPLQQSAMDELQLGGQGDSSGEGPIERVVFATPHGNEHSNLSSAGSISDREPETPGRNSNSRPAPEKKTVRKRKKGEDTPRPEKKITDFIKSSPKRSRVSSMAAPSAASYLNGEDLHSSHMQQMQHPMMGGGYGMMGGENNHHNMWQQHSSYSTHQLSASSASPSRITPTPHSSSDSNSSPPTSRGGPPSGLMYCKVDEETQTDQHDGRVDASAMSDEIAKRERTIDDLARQNDDLQRQLMDKTRRLEGSKETIKRLLMEQNAMRRKALRDRTSNDNPRIGCYKFVRHGDSFKEMWQEGWANDELEKRTKAVSEERNEIVNASQLLKKRKPVSKENKSSRSLNAQMNALADGGMGGMNNSNTANTTSTSVLLSLPGCSTGSSNNDDGFTRPELPMAPYTPMEYQEQEEIYRLRKEHLKKEEADIQLEKEKLDRERQLHIRELKRASNENDSRFKDHQLLNQRYLLLCLLGKGGFSEVWKAYDLDENRYVACKIHHVNKDWKEDKKANYVKHAMREKDIHKTLVHDRIVRLYDLFTIDNHSFATVLEYCSGNDLDFFLKQNRQIPEKEARSITMQVISALIYLAERKPPIIHYDLKPANILLENGMTSGAIKITDFGLSKVMENSDDMDSIELTSQFAGTYWYLPPETFVVGHAPPKISSKVDVWSVGVILYQCIYGKRPFGHEQTQQKILEEKTIIKAKEVVFPSKPQISPAAQQFIRRCLQYRKEDRADVFELANHDFFKFGSRAEKKLGTPASPASRMNKSESIDGDRE